MEPVWVTFGPGMPVGARKLNAELMGAARPGTVWLDVCILGQHLPQMYRESEIHPLLATDCSLLGLCETCLGFGDLGLPAGSAYELARGSDEVGHPCPSCGGSGRPCLRVTIRRDGSSTQGELKPLPHAYIPPRGMDPDTAAIFEVPQDMCLACGNAQDGKGPRGEALHT